METGPEPSVEEPSSLEELLDRIGRAAGSADGLSIRDALDVAGSRSFAPPLLLAGLITLAPIIGDIPGVPTLVALVVLLTMGQLVMGRENFWLPDWLLDRSVDEDTLSTVLDWVQRPARWADRLTRPRLVRFIRGGGAYLVAAACIAIALSMPFLELVPFSANGAGVALSAFGVAMIADDGLLALVAFAITLITFAGVGYSLLG